MGGSMARMGRSALTEIFREIFLANEKTVKIFDGKSEKKIQECGRARAETEENKLTVCQIMSRRPKRTG
jgi:hypothetical protein